MAAGTPGFSLGGLFSGADAELRQPGREEEVQECGVPFTVARFSRLTDAVGGVSYLEFQQGAAEPGELSREDAALVATRAIQFPPPPGQGVVFSAGGAGRGVGPQGDEWAEMFGRLEGQPVTTQEAAA